MLLPVDVSVGPLAEEEPEFLFRMGQSRLRTAGAMPISRRKKFARPVQHPDERPEHDEEQMERRCDGRRDTLRALDRK